MMSKYYNCHTHKHLIDNEIVNLNLDEISEIEKINYRFSISLHPWRLEVNSVKFVTDTLSQFGEM